MKRGWNLAAASVAVLALVALVVVFQSSLTHSPPDGSGPLTTPQGPPTSSPTPDDTQPTFLYIIRPPPSSTGDVLDLKAWTDFEGTDPSFHWTVTDATGVLYSEGSGNGIRLPFPESGTARVTVALRSQGEDVASATRLFDRNTFQRPEDTQCPVQEGPHACQPISFEITPGNWLIEVEASFEWDGEAQGALVVTDPDGNEYIDEAATFTPSVDLWFWRKQVNSTREVIPGTWTAELRLEGMGHANTVTWQIETYGSGRLLEPDRPYVDSMGVMPEQVEKYDLQIAASSLGGWWARSPTFFDAFTGHGTVPPTGHEFLWSIKDSQGRLVHEATGSSTWLKFTHSGLYDVMVEARDAHNLVASATARIGISDGYPSLLRCDLSQISPAVQCDPLLVRVEQEVKSIRIAAYPYGPWDPGHESPPISLGEVVGTLTLYDAEGEVVAEGEERRTSHGSAWEGQVQHFSIHPAEGIWTLEWKPGPGGGIPNGGLWLQVNYLSRQGTYLDIRSVLT